MTSNRSKHLKVLLGIFLTLFVFTGCSEPSDPIGLGANDSFAPAPLPMGEDLTDRGDLASVEPTHNGAWIDAAGGTVELEFCELVIPEGALTKPTFITVAERISSHGKEDSRQRAR